MPTRDERLSAMAREAVAIEAATGQDGKRGYPPRLLLAQWALESSWGERCTGDFNYFGITYNPKRHKAFRMCPTHEEMTEAQILSLSPEEAATITSKTLIRAGVFRIGLRRKFASYSSLSEALSDKTRLIMNTDRYRFAFMDFQQSGDVEKLIRSIAAAGYATAGGYGETLVQISRQGNIAQAVERARKEMAAA
jgi:flagellum-specific peptidoglycan hydrolase FlgJ